MIDNDTDTDTDTDTAGGNGIFLSNHCWRTNLLGNTIAHAGDSAILLVGSTRYMNGTADTYPAYTNISNNLLFEMGFYGKQTAAYFKSIAYKTNLVNNVFFNSPRSLVNYNDAYRGGDLMEGNVMWGAVKETADHASFNVSNSHHHRPSILAGSSTKDPSDTLLPVCCPPRARSPEL